MSDEAGAGIAPEYWRRDGTESARTTEVGTSTSGWRNPADLGPRERLGRGVQNARGTVYCAHVERRTREVRQMVKASRDGRLATSARTGEIVSSSADTVVGRHPERNARQPWVVPTVALGWYINDR